MKTFPDTSRVYVPKKVVRPAKAKAAEMGISFQEFTALALQNAVKQGVSSVAACGQDNDQSGKNT